MREKDFKAIFFCKSVSNENYGRILYVYRALVYLFDIKKLGHIDILKDLWDLYCEIRSY